MKLRIEYRHGVWSCAYKRSDMVSLLPIGYGHTPREAYDDWQQQSESDGSIEDWSGSVKPRTAPLIAVGRVRHSHCEGGA